MSRARTTMQRLSDAVVFEDRRGLLDGCVGPKDVLQH
jgi:hypothetical protein